MMIWEKGMIINRLFGLLPKWAVPEANPPYVNTTDAVPLTFA